MMRQAITTLMFLLSLNALAALGQKVTWEELDWRIISGEHFDVHYPEGYETLGRTALLYAEEANIVLSENLQHNLTQVIPIFVYPSHSHFQMTNIIFSTLDEGIGGFTERIKKRVVVPFLGSYDDFRHVVTHELVHAFQYDILLGTGFGGLLASQYAPNPPLWAIEGMAEYLSIGWDETADMTIRDAIATDTLPSIEQMTNMQVSSGYMLYKGGQSVMAYIAEVYGIKKIGEFLKDLRDQRGIEEAIKTNFGIPLKRFDANWRLWVKRRHYKIIEKRFDDEEATLISRHFDDHSFLNMHPSISPDGKKVAYLTIRDFFPSLVIRNAKDINNKPDYNLNDEVEDPEEEILVRSSDNHEFYQLHLLDNRLSFTPDSKNLFFCVRSGGKDHLYLFNIEKKKVIKKYTPAVDMIQYPRLSYDGTKAVFAASILGQTDIYMLDLKTSKIRQITFDMFSEKDPSLSGDNKRILYSSNKNSVNDIELSRYNIYEYNLEANSVRQLTSDKGKQTSAVYYYRDKNHRILYTSNQTGVSNIYILDSEEGTPYQVTDTEGGVFEPQIDRSAKQILFTMYRRQGYDIAIKKAPDDPDLLITDPIEIATFERPDYPVYPGGLSSSKPRAYNLRASPDWFFFGFQYSNSFGFGGFVQLAASDYLGNHVVSGYLDYLSNRENMNFAVNYGYLKKRFDVYFGVFKATNFISILNLTDLNTVNDFLFNPFFLYNSINRYGAHVTVSYPFTPFLRLNSRVEISRIEDDFKPNLAPRFSRPDIYTNLNATSVSLTYNNVLYSYFGPLRGLHFSIGDQQSVNLSGNDLVFNRQSFDVRYYLLFGGRYVFASRFFGGNVEGRDRRFFPYQIGGFNTIRGYEYLEFQGTKTFMLNLELRYPIIDAVAFGFPVPWVIRGFSGVLFIDIGTAYSDPKSWQGWDSDNKQLKDLRASFGLGTRFVLFPGLLLKIDWATPWNLRTAQNISKWQGIFSIGYEY